MKIIRKYQDGGPSEQSKKLQKTLFNTPQEANYEALQRFYDIAGEYPKSAYDWNLIKDWGKKILAGSQEEQNRLNGGTYLKGVTVLPDQDNKNRVRTTTYKDWAQENQREREVAKKQSIDKQRFQFEQNVRNAQNDAAPYVAGILGAAAAPAFVEAAPAAFQALKATPYLARTIAKPITKPVVKAYDALPSWGKTTVRGVGHGLNLGFGAEGAVSLPSDFEKVYNSLNNNNYKQLFLDVSGTALDAAFVGSGIQSLRVLGSGKPATWLGKKIFDKAIPQNVNYTSDVVKYSPEYVNRNYNIIGNKVLDLFAPNPKTVSDLYKVGLPYFVEDVKNAIGDYKMHSDPIPYRLVGNYEEMPLMKYLNY